MPPRTTPFRAVGRRRYAVGMNRYLIALPALLALAGCEGLVPCTDAGCADGVVVQLVGAPADEQFLTLEAPGEDPVVLSCTASGCHGLETRPDFTPEEVTLTYEAEDTTIVRSFELEYEEYRPNGRYCSPVCRIAEVRFVVE